MENNEHNMRQQQTRFWLDYSHQLATAIRYVEALAAVERALALDETNAEAHYVRGTCMAMLARYDEALTDFNATLQRDETYVPAWDGKAWVLGIMGKKEEALAAITRALELDPDYFEAVKRKKRLEAMIDKFKG
jgi:tetratricopeptide (TPR) repeat protein